MVTIQIKSQGFYDATFNFRTETLGIHETTEWVDTASNNRCTLIEMIAGHKNIWEANSKSAGGLAGALTNSTITVALSGSAEIYLRCDDLNGIHKFDLYSDASGQIARVYLDGPNNDIYYTDDLGSHASGNGLAVDTWYHVSIRWRATGGAAYQGLAEDTFKFFIDGVEYGDYGLVNDAGVDKAVIGSSTALLDTIGYFDAIGFTSEGYTIGDNLSLAAHTDITAYHDECTIDAAIRKPPQCKTGIWGQTFESDDRLIFTDILTDRYNAKGLSEIGKIYKDSLAFRDETIGAFPTNTTHGTYTDNTAGDTDVNMIDKFNGHAFVLQCEDYDAANLINFKYVLTSTSFTAGTFECWIATTDPTYTTDIRLYNDANQSTAGIRIDNDLWGCRHNAGWAAMGGTAPVIGKWYRLVMTFDCTTDTVNYYVYDENGTSITSATGKTMGNSPSYVKTMWVYGNSGDSNYIFFIDAVGFTIDSNYAIGDNDELDVTLTAQTIYEGRITTESTKYIQQLDLESISMEMSQNQPGYDATYQPDGWNPNIANYTDEVFSEIITDKLNETTATKTTEVYRGSLSFENDTDATFPMGFLDTSTLANSVTVDATGVGNHQYILKLNDTDGASKPEVQYYLEAQANGTIEFWFRTDDCTFQTLFRLLDGSGNVITGFRCDADDLYYYEDPGGGAQWTAMAVPGGDPADDTWYRVRIDFECGAGEYLDLSADTGNIYIYDTAGTELDKAEGFTFGNACASIQYLDIGTGIGDSGYIAYFDAIGFSWDADYTIGDNNHIYVEKFQVGTGTIDYTLNGEHAVDRLGCQIDVLDGYVWTIRGNHEVTYSDGSLDTEITIATGDWRDCRGLRAIERFNRVVCKGGFSGGARVIGEADDTDAQATYGIIPIIRFYANITTEATLDSIASSILTLQSNVPKIIELDYRNTTIGMLQVGQTIYIPASTVFYDDSNLTYVDAGYWLIIRNIYDPRRMNNHLILSNYLYFEYNWKLDEELESLANQT